MKSWLVCAIGLIVGTASAQSSGGLYIAGVNFDFRQAVERAIAQNSGVTFFILAIPPASKALSHIASDEARLIRERAVAAGASFLICQRDIDSGSITLADLIPGIVAVRGWPPPGSDALPQGSNYYPDENPSSLPSSTEQLRRLRSACS